MNEYRRIQAFKAGAKARAACRPRSICNRPRGTIFYDDWQDGYSASQSGEVRP